MDGHRAVKIHVAVSGFGWFKKKIHEIVKEKKNRCGRNRIGKGKVLGLVSTKYVIYMLKFSKINN